MTKFHDKHVMYIKFHILNIPIAKECVGYLKIFFYSLINLNLYGLFKSSNFC